MHLITITTSHGRALSALCFLFSITLLLLVTAGPVAASTESRRMEGPPTPTSIAPWSARCYTDTCVGFSVTFDGGHVVALSHPSDAPSHWAIFEGDELTADEAAFAAATVAALEHHDLPGLAAAYPALPSWYLDSLAAYVAPNPPVYRLLLPLLRC